MASRNSKPSARGQVIVDNDLGEAVRRSFERSCLMMVHIRKLEQVYEDLLSVDSFASILERAIDSHDESFGADCSNLIREMQRRLRDSSATLDNMGANILRGFTDAEATALLEDRSKEVAHA